MVAPLYTTDSGLLFHAGKILILTVGLPARGKTHISRALERYLRWMGVKTQVVSLGDYRRKTLGGAQKLPNDYFTPGEFRWCLVFVYATSRILPLTFFSPPNQHRPKESRNASIEKNSIRGVREADMELFRWGRSSRHLRCE